MSVWGYGTKVPVGVLIGVRLAIVGESPIQLALPSGSEKSYCVGEAHSHRVLPARRRLNALPPSLF